MAIIFHAQEKRAEATKDLFIFFDFELALSIMYA